MTRKNSDNHNPEEHQGDDEAINCEIELTDEAFYTYVSIASDRLFQHIANVINLLKTNPKLGHTYGPAYETAKPPVACRVAYCEHFGIYYQLSEDTQTVIVLAIEDQRRNPDTRFSAYQYLVTSLEDESDAKG